MLRRQLHDEKQGVACLKAQLTFAMNEGHEKLECHELGEVAYVFVQFCFGQKARRDVRIVQYVFRIVGVVDDPIGRHVEQKRLEENLKQLIVLAHARAQLIEHHDELVLDGRDVAK